MVVLATGTVMIAMFQSGENDWFQTVLLKKKSSFTGHYVPCMVLAFDVVHQS